MLAGAIDKFHLSRYGLAIVLVFIGLKMLWFNELYGAKFPIEISPGIICGVITVSIMLLLLFPRKGAAAEKKYFFSKSGNSYEGGSVGNHVLMGKQAGAESINVLQACLCECKKAILPVG
ncbi:MAG: hypothetical protein V1799_05465 [bacterium]